MKLKVKVKVKVVYSIRSSNSINNIYIYMCITNMYIYICIHITYFPFWKSIPTSMWETSPGSDFRFAKIQIQSTNSWLASSKTTGTVREAGNITHKLRKFFHRISRESLWEHTDAGKNPGIFSDFPGVFPAYVSICTWEISGK